MDLYYLVGILNAGYKPQIFKTTDKTEAFNNFALVYGLSKEEKETIQLFKTFISEKAVEKWFNEHRKPLDEY